MCRVVLEHSVSMAVAQGNDNLSRATKRRLSSAFLQQAAEGVQYDEYVGQSSFEEHEVHTYIYIYIYVETWDSLECHTRVCDIRSHYW